MRSNCYKNRKLCRFLTGAVILWLNLFLVRPCIVSGQSLLASENGSANYYLQLKTNEFQKAMLPRERYLLDIAKNTAEELKERERSGDLDEQVQLNAVVSPEKKLLEEYIAELQLVNGLLDEIADLERAARKKVNLEVLDALSNLRNRVKQMVNGSMAALKEKPDTETSVAEKDQSGDDTHGAAEEEPRELSQADIFEEWKYNRILEYKMKMSRWELLRTKLIDTASSQEYDRMFRREMRSALEHYQSGDLQTARLEFENILRTYTRIRVLDDLLYFSGEAAYGRNYFDEAIDKYLKVAHDYRDSDYAPRALIKLIFIYSIYGDFSSIDKCYTDLTPLFGKIEDEEIGVVSYLAGYSYFKIGMYEKVFGFLKHIPLESTYYYPSLYLAATCYANIGLTDKAVEIFNILVSQENKGGEDPVLEQIRNNALLKLGLVYYDQGNHDLAVSYLDRVDSDYQHYDLTILGKAWSEFRSGKPGEALRDVEELLQNTMVSNYAYEARVLAASVKDLLGYREEAMREMKDAYTIGTMAEKVLKSEDSEPSDKELIMSRQREQQRALLEEVSKIRNFLQTSLSWQQPGSTDQNQPKTTASETQDLMIKIGELDRLEEVARNSQDSKMLAEIRSLRSGLITALQEKTDRFTDKNVQGGSIINRLGINEYLRYTFQSLLTEMVREKKRTVGNIKKARELVTAARDNDDFSIQIRAEIRSDELKDYYRRLNQYEVWLRENFPQEANIEIDRWASFSGYGISNINFMRIKEYDTRIADVARVIDTIDDIFIAKRKDLDNRIQGLLSDVEKIEEQMQVEALKRQSAEKDKFFKNEYFIKQKREAAAGQLKEKPEKSEKEQ